MLFALFRIPALLQTHAKVQRALKQQSFDQVLAQFAPRSVAHSPPNADNLMRARFFTRCLRHYGGRFRSSSACLDQSIALRHFLAEQKIDAVLKIGIKRNPFAAHAWIEVAGTPVLEADHLKRDFVCFDTLPEGTIALLNPFESKPKQ